MKRILTEWRKYLAERKGANIETLRLIAANPGSCVNDQGYYSGKDTADCKQQRAAKVKGAAGVDKKIKASLGPETKVQWNFCQGKKDGTLVRGMKGYMCRGGTAVDAASAGRGEERQRLLQTKFNKLYNKARKEMQKAFPAVQKIYNEKVFNLDEKERDDFKDLIEYALIAGFGDVKPDDIKTTFNPDHSGPSHVPWHPDQSSADKKSKYQANYLKFKKKRSDLLLKTITAIGFDDIAGTPETPPAVFAPIARGYQTLMKFLRSNERALQAAYNFHLAAM